jgi:hypothetical protein
LRDSDTRAIGGHPVQRCGAVLRWFGRCEHPTQRAGTVTDGTSAFGLGGLVSERPVTENQWVLAEHQSRFSTQTKYGADLLKMLERSNCGVWRVEKDPGSSVPRWWLNITLPDNVAEMFDVQLEIQVLYAEYSRLEPRALEQVQTRVRRDLRLDPGIVVIASEDPNVGQMARRRRGELSIIDVHLPSLSTDRRDLRARISSVMTAVDHYDVTNPIQDPSGFFGRTEEVAQLKYSLDRGQSVGVFGLRKQGKTSLLNALERLRRDTGHLVVKLDMSEISSAAEFRLRLLTRTWQAVHDLDQSGDGPGRRMPKLRMLTPQGQAKADLGQLDMFWTDDLRSLIDSSGTQLELFVDEVDQAYPARSNLLDDEPVRLFQALTQLRGLLQTATPNAGLVLLCAGVDPAIFESAMIEDRDNLVYKLVRLVWLSPMTRDETADMVRTLGKRMGIRIPDFRAVDSLFEEYGGHPLLSRKACSLAAKGRDPEVLPWVITAQAIATAIESRSYDSPATQARDIFKSFHEWFPQEADLVEMLWSTDAFSHSVAVEELRESPDRVDHARAYGLLNADLSPRMNAVRTALRA